MNFYPEGCGEGIWKGEDNIMSHWKRKKIQIELKLVGVSYALAAFIVIFPHGTVFYQ